MAVKKAKYPVKLILPTAGKAGDGPCGCRFGYKLGFKIVCEFHIAQRETLRQERIAANSVIHDLWPEATKPRARKKRKPDTVEFQDAFRAEIARRTKILKKERGKISRPTRKLNKRQREHLHTFAFTAEQVRKELLDSIGTGK